MSVMPLTFHHHARAKIILDVHRGSCVTYFRCHLFKNISSRSPREQAYFCQRQGTHTIFVLSVTIFSTHQQPYSRHRWSLRGSQHHPQPACHLVRASHPCVIAVFAALRQIASPSPRPPCFMDSRRQHTGNDTLATIRACALPPSNSFPGSTLRVRWRESSDTASRRKAAR